MQINDIAAAEEAPAQVRRAVWLLWTSLVIGLLQVALEWEPVRLEFEGWDGVMGIILTISFLVPAVLIVFISRGHRWARMATAIMTLVGIAFYLAWPHEGAPEPWQSAVMTWVLSAMDVLALYWLFTGNGARWFSKAQAQPAVEQKL